MCQETCYDETACDETACGETRCADISCEETSFQDTDCRQTSSANCRQVINTAPNTKPAPTPTEIACADAPPKAVLAEAQLRLQRDAHSQANEKMLKATKELEERMAAIDTCTQQKVDVSLSVR